MKDKSRTIKIIGLILALMAGLGISSLLMRSGSSKDNAAAAGSYFCLTEGLPQAAVLAEDDALDVMTQILADQGEENVTLRLARKDQIDGDTFYRFTQLHQVMSREPLTLDAGPFRRADRGQFRKASGRHGQYHRPHQHGPGENHRYRPGGPEGG